VQVSDVRLGAAGGWPASVSPTPRIIKLVAMHFFAINETQNAVPTNRFSASQHARFTKRYLTWLRAMRAPPRSHLNTGALTQKPAADSFSGREGLG
jgi:hypothetical protein